MNRKEIPVSIQRALYAESMGKCMNPNCHEDLFIGDGDITEKAHIDAYCETENNSFDNLVILCPNCHEKFDKLHLFTDEEVHEWKNIRKKEVQNFFSIKYSNFEQLAEQVVPLLLENKQCYENYYLSGNKVLWDKFEYRTLVNNRKLKTLLISNLHLFQKSKTEEYSNAYLVQQLLAHIDEFEKTRCDKEKIRQVLFPQEINSIFGIEPVSGAFFQSTESLEALIKKLSDMNLFKKIVLGVGNPYILFSNGENIEKLLLNDTPRLRQIYYDYKCFRTQKMRFESLNFVYTRMRLMRLKWKFTKKNNLREINVNGKNIIFVYEYCISEAYVTTMFVPENIIVVNLHGWNGDLCITQKAYECAEKLGIKLMTTDKFLTYLKEIKNA